ncbi:caspase family protein [Streptomyces sp. NBC_01614]|uniref:Caspase family protein n=1 Tax=Streptomyces sp. NBC_00180 TaxID=2903632 RepID=A0AAU1I406_9ACTN
MGSIRHHKGQRRALVVGISHTPELEEDERLAQRFPPLTCAPQDVALVGNALRQSRYEVTPVLDPGGSELLGKLHKFLSSCAPGDTAVVYLSCHGETVDGRDHLLPRDAQPGDELPDGGHALLSRTLIPADPDGLLTGLRSECTVVVCLDICRTSAGTPPEVEQERTTLLSRHENVYWLHSCAQGERSYADPEKGSWFGRALAEALGPTSPPTTFPEVVRYVRGRVIRMADTFGMAPPTIEPYTPHGWTSDAQDPLVLCEGSREASRWTTMIETSLLWDHTSGTAEVHRRVKHGLTSLVEYVAGTLQGAGAHRDDPWTDPNWPVRMVDRLGNLVKQARLKGRDLLSPAETAALLAGPVVHEGLVTVALEELRRILPERMDTDGDEAGHVDTEAHVRGAAKDVCRAHSQVRRTTDTLRRRNLREQAVAADHWLRHRFIADWDPLWERTGDYPAVDELLDHVVDVVLAGAENPSGKPPGETSRRRVDGQLRQVLAHVTVHPSSSPRINDPQSGDAWDTYPPMRGSQWRAPELALLLWISGLLAADPRRMSGVLVDHLGAHEQLVPRSIVAALSAEFGYDDTPVDATDAVYRPAVRFDCPHPALHVAIEELVGYANNTVAALRAEWHKQRTSPTALLRGLPEQVTTDQLVPLNQRYKQPLERFRLAEDEIRPLLMGTQLYGDRMLAVRELYQNALDACRHRDMRHRYGVAQGRRAPDWEPTITFTQGWDDNGRPYIACRDNGSGMTRAKLTSMFARAGRRYEQDPEFVQERRNWRRAGLQEMPLNSRFGIGVFSYFMLADEVVVWTNAVDRYGRPEQPHTLRADIQSGSGLLRIGDDPEVTLGGGTLVRLYLSPDETLPSLVETLESQLWVSDCTVMATECDQNDPGQVLRSVTWRPGELRVTEPAWYGEPARAHDDAWLVQGQGKLLLDGVVVKDAPAVYGYVANLRERHRPEPSVDRNNMRSYDDELVMRELLRSVPRACAQWDEVSLNSLWQLSESVPRLAVAVLDALPDHTSARLEPPEQGDRFLPRRLPLSRVGCLPIDESLLDWSETPMQLDGNKDSSGSSLLGRWQQTRLATSTVTEPFAPGSYPTPMSLDSLLFHNDEPRGWATALNGAYLGRISLGELVRAWRRYAVAGFLVPTVDDIRSLRDVRPDEAMAELYAEYASARQAKPLAFHAPLLMISVKHQIPLGRACELLERLRALDPALPAPPELDQHLASERVTRTDQITLTGDGLMFGQRSGIIHPVDLLSRVGHYSLDELVDRVKHFAPLGWSLAAEPTPAAREQGELSAAERFLLSRDLDERAPWMEGRIPLGHVVKLAQAASTTLKAQVEQINRSAPATQVVAPELPPEAEEWIPSAENPLLGALEEEAVPVGPWECVFLLKPDRYRVRPEAAEQARNQVNMLQVCGRLSPEASDRIDDVIKQTAMVKSLLFHSGRLAGRTLDTAGLTYVHALATSASTDLPLGNVYEYLEDEERHLPLRIVRPVPEALSLQATFTDLHALTPNNSEFKKVLTIFDLLEHAVADGSSVSDSHRRLQEFTVLGAPAPPGQLDGVEGEFLEAFVPNTFDLAAFEAGVLLGGGTMGPLELVLTAGRFGWTLGQAYNRYAPFRCLGLNVATAPPNECEDELAPDWRDVIILTRQLTGRAPALSGPVDHDHVLLCAEETDLTEKQVRERLARYARLFSLELPSDGLAPLGLRPEESSPV